MVAVPASMQEARRQQRHPRQRIRAARREPLRGVGRIVLCFRQALHPSSVGPAHCDPALRALPHGKLRLRPQNDRGVHFHIRPRQLGVHEICPLRLVLVGREVLALPGDGREDVGTEGGDQISVLQTRAVSRQADLAALVVCHVLDASARRHRVLHLPDCLSVRLLVRVLSGVHLGRVPQDDSCLPRPRDEVGIHRLAGLDFGWNPRGRSVRAHQGDLGRRCKHHGLVAELRARRGCETLLSRRGRRDGDRGEARDLRRHGLLLRTAVGDRALRRGSPRPDPLRRRSPRKVGHHLP
mmetsp:Transcript_75908/g.210705  ORF Transcript_75908/g.210705 Transcript_75908/m.210705 type:complete len:296 (-) Transcript_75908:1162-2049(-)